MILSWTILSCLFIFSGCEILKGKKSTATDSTNVFKKDTVHLITTQASNRQDSTWWREIISFMPRGGDTTLIRTTVPVNNYYPTQIIREGGSISQEYLLRIADSVARSHQDSSTVKSVINEKTKETKVLTQWWIWVIAGLVLLCLAMIVGRYLRTRNTHL